MNIPKILPTNPFWNFSVKVYRYPLVEEGLLSLQNERGLNVNVLLFCFWYVLTDQGRLAKAELKKIVVSIQPWHERIVLPLRRIRHNIKLNIAPPWPKIKAELLKQELAAEQIEQLIIADNFVYKTRPIRDNFQKIIDICRNIAVYCHLLNVFLDLEDCRKITNILATIFYKIDREDILRYCMEYLIEKELQSLSLTAQFPLDL